LRCDLHRSFAAMPFVNFEHIAREWRCKWTADNDNASLMAVQGELEKALPALSGLEGVVSVQRIVCGDCQDFKVVTKLTKPAFEAWSKGGFEPEAEFLAAAKKIAGVSAVETQTYTLEEVKLNKKDLKKAQEKAEKEKAAKAAEAPKAPEDPAKVLKKAIKEGGKRGVEIEGAADMGGLQFFCTNVEVPEGDVTLLMECTKAMNAKSDPTEEERKGGSGHIGKMVFSAGLEQLAIVAYVPEAKQGELSCQEWLEKVVSVHSGGKIVEGGAEYSVGVIPANHDKNIFPLKIREGLILEANNFLRKKGLFPEDDGDDDDEMVFGDDDFPSM